MKRVFIVIALGIIGLASAAVEDPSGFSDTVDTNSKMTETSTRVTVSALYRQSEAWCADDKGVGHFNGDFSHQLEIYNDYIDTWELYGQWALANVANDQYYCTTTNPQTYVHVRSYNNNGTYQILLYVRESGSAVGSDSSTGISLDTTYFLTVARDYNGGAGGANSYTVTIRLNSHTDTPEDTLAAENSSGTQVDYRYVYMTQSVDSGSGNDLRAWVQNLDLQEGVVSAMPQVIHIRIE